MLLLAFALLEEAFGLLSDDAFPGAIFGHDCRLRARPCSSILVLAGISGRVMGRCLRNGESARTLMMFRGEDRDNVVVGLVVVASIGTLLHDLLDIGAWL